MFDDKHPLGIDHCLKKKNVVGIDHPNSWQASRKASVRRDEKRRQRKKEALNPERVERKEEEQM